MKNNTKNIREGVTAILFVAIMIASVLVIMPAATAQEGLEAGGYIYTKIDLPGEDWSEALDINNNGQIVGAYDDASGETHGFLVEGDSFSKIDVPGAEATEAYGINDAGKIVGWYLDPHVEHGFLLEGGDFSTIDVPTGTWLDPVGTSLRGINNADQIVGTYYDCTSAKYSFLLDGGRFTTIDVPGASTTMVSDINDAGQIVGSFYVRPISLDEPGRWYGFLLDGGSFTTIDVPGSRESRATGINNAGQIVGVYIDSIGIHGFLLEDGRFTRIDPLESIEADANGINDNGEIVGWFYFDGIDYDTFSFIATPADVNEPPAASFTYTPEKPMVGGRIKFNASSSYDPEGGEIVLYEWVFGNGTPPASATIPEYAHKFDSPEKYTITLTVTDDDGAQNSTSTELDLSLEVGNILLCRSDNSKVPCEEWTHAGMYVGMKYGVPSVVEQVNSPVVPGGPKGVILTPLSRWSWPDMTYVGAFRVRTQDSRIPEDAADFIYSKLDQPYDLPKLLQHVFFCREKSIDDDSWYCSEIVWAAYMKASNGAINLDHNAPADIIVAGSAVPPDDLCSGPYIELVGEHKEVRPETFWSWARHLGGIAYCPVDVTVTDPDGLILANQDIQIPSGIYEEVDINGDGEVDKFFILPDPKNGGYQIKVTSEPAALPEDTYSLEVIGNGETLVLAEDTLVDDIPEQPYVIWVAGHGINNAPVASLRHSPESPVVGQEITFDASSSYDLDGEIVSYNWNFGDESIAESEVITHAYTEAGEYTVTLTVTDDDGGVGSDMLTITVENVPPFANAGDDQTVEQTYYQGAVVTFDGSGSNDPDGDPLTYLWTWNGDSAADINPTVSLPLGTTIITLVVNDGTEDSDPDTVVVTVIDTTPPEITCPADMTVEQASAAGTAVSLTATATDICDSDVKITSDAPAIFPLGMTTVTFMATDDSGNSASCSMTVTVEDTTSGEQTIKIYPSQDTYIQTWPEGNLPNSNMGGRSNMLVGAYVNSDQEARPLMQFDLSSINGEVTSARLHMYRYYKYYNQPLVANVHRVTQSWDEGSVTWNKYDGTNNWASAGGDFDTTVIASRTLAGTGTGGPYADKSQERWDDTWNQWDVTSLVQDWVEGTQANNGLLLKGTTFWHVMSGFYSKDYSNSAYWPYLEITITGVDTTPPVITCPADVTVNTDSGVCYATGVALGSPTVSDNCDTNPTVANNAPTQFSKGTTTVTWTATDASGNSATCTQTVTVNDNEAPTITCPADVTVEQATAAGTEVLLTATATDICDADVAITSDAPAIFPLGTTTVTFTATDDSVNSASDTVIVTVQDTTAPVLTCPEDVIVEQETAAGTEVLLTATATDICDADVEITSDELANYPLGETTVTFTATDDSGNSVTKSMTVHVIDTTPPELTIPGDVTVEQETRDGTMVELTATATDICDADVDITSDELANYPLGETTVTFTATDDSSNSVTKSMTVHVIDTTSPELTIPGDVTVEQATAAGTEVPVTATAEDICDADVEITSDAPAIFPLGTTTVTFTATDDSGNSVSDTVVVTVVATTPPEVVSMDLLKQAVTELEAAKTGDKKTDKDIDKAIEHIQKSLEDELWVDGLHIDMKHGKKVFDEGKKAVKCLTGVGTTNDIIEKIVQADEELAKTAIDDAKATTVTDPKKQDKVDKEIAKAEDELAKAEDELNKGKPDKAIDHYKKAWEHAQQAIKHAQ